MTVGSVRLGNLGSTARRMSQPARGVAVAALVLVAALMAEPSGAREANAGLLANGSFEEGLTSWQPTASRPGLKVETLSAPAPRAPGGGAGALRVSGRRWRTETVGQDLTSALREAGSGNCYVLRFRVRPDAPASVRGLLQLTDDEGKHEVILAERVVREPGDWGLVQGSWPLSWKGELKQATLTFDVSQVPEGVFPDFSLDDVALAPDADGDRLSDREEADLGTNPASADTDGDGMSDDWECEHKLDPRRADAEGDADGDGFTNGQEYWAASDPRGPASYPGKPSDPNASADTRQLLRYLALLPSHKDRRVVVGQHITNVEPEYQTDVVRLHEETGQWVGLLALQYDGQQQHFQIGTVNPTALSWWKAGGLVKIKWSVSNPWTGKSRNDRPQRGEPDYIDVRGLIDPEASRDPAAREANRKAHEVYLGWLDEVAAGLAELRDAGVVVLWRPTSEMNGRWFWWGGRPREDYVAMWRHMHDYFSRAKGLNNLIWVYESDSSVHGMIASDYYYPGDDVVDVMGHNFYNDTWDLPYDAGYVYRQYPKVYAFPQAGPGTGIRDGSWDGMTYVRMVQARYPRCSFFAAWNSYTWKGGRERVHLAIVDNRNARQLLEHPWVVTRDELAWRTKTPE